MLVSGKSFGQFEQNVGERAHEKNHNILVCTNVMLKYCLVVEMVVLKTKHCIFVVIEIMVLQWLKAVCNEFVC